MSDGAVYATIVLCIIGICTVGFTAEHVSQYCNKRWTWRSRLLAFVGAACIAPAFVRLWIAAIAG